MKKITLACLIMAAGLLNISCSKTEQKTVATEGTELGAAEIPQAQTAAGTLEGINESGVAVFKGVPFAAPPVGELRWKAPQPVEKWEGVRKATEFGPNPMQEVVFGDMAFGTKENSEDCLYLNIWTPAKSTTDKLPVFIYFNGGGLFAGSGSEPRYAGLTFARNGVVAITANYREGIFGFFAHPELSAETEYKGSGNYGYMDQAAAIQWVKDNIAAFGGDPNHITIMGESAGSMSVSALMASPLSRDNIAQAMGSSGSVFDKPWLTLEEAEAAGVEQAKSIGCSTLAELRAMSAEDLLTKAHITGVPVYNIDNYFMPKQPAEIFMAGEQAQVPCLIGNNSAEFFPNVYIPEMTVAAAQKAVQGWLKTQDNVDELLGYYGINSDEDLTKLPGFALAGDMFIAYNTWQWLELQKTYSKAPVYRYRFCCPRPELIDANKVSALAGGTREKEEGEEAAPTVPGAFHSVDIEYQMGTIPTTPIYAWTAKDFNVSQVFVSYFVNFIKTGNPNGLGLPNWETINGKEIPPVMCIDENTYLEKDETMQKRYQFIDKYIGIKNQLKK